MRWFKPNLRGSIHAIFASSRSSAPPPESSVESTIEQIREAMLALLALAGEDRFPHVTRRIRYATDVQGLWYLRGDLMAVLASSLGEAAALEQIEVVSQMFREVLPQGLRSRPSPLSSGSK
jgi:hypothetical protein